MSANSPPPRPATTPTLPVHSMHTSSILGALPTVPATSNPSCSGRRIRGPPKVLKVYFIPACNQVLKSSIIHFQKKEGGFFQHPALIVTSDRHSRTAEFYAITSYPPKAIHDLKMYLYLGDTVDDEGPGTLKLAAKSDRMPRDSYLNLDQRFAIEWEYLNKMPWGVDVNIDGEDRKKLDFKISQLEAQQNRYIYKSLLASFHVVAPGTIVMLSNPPNSSTLGAPILVLVNNFPFFRFLRVKLQADNASFRLRGIPKYEIGQKYCLRLSRNPEGGIDGKPVLLFEHGSPELREPSFVEVTQEVKTTTADRLKTWCVPPVKVQSASMSSLWDYMEKLSRHSRNTQPREYFRPVPSSLPAGRQNIGECFPQHQQHGLNCSYAQPQGRDMQSPVPFHSTAVHNFMPNVTTDYPQYYRSNGSLRAQSSGQDALQFPVNGVNYHPQSHVPLHEQQLPTLGPLTHQFARIEPTFVPAYYPHPSNGYVHFVHPSAPVHPQGTYVYAATNFPAHPGDAQFSRTRAPYTADSTPHTQVALPWSNLHHW
ncbi:hypothetical protein PMIN03_005839 [Paraphaeosphaeria minitans]